jgi:hypothetical protein
MPIFSLCEYSKGENGDCLFFCNFCQIRQLVFEIMVVCHSFVVDRICFRYTYEDIKYCNFWILKIYSANTISDLFCVMITIAVIHILKCLLRNSKIFIIVAHIIHCVSPDNREKSLL